MLNYQDHLTKIVSLRMLKNEHTEEVVYHIVDFLLLEHKHSPIVIKMVENSLENGREFTSAAVAECVAM